MLLALTLLICQITFYFLHYLKKVSKTTKSRTMGKYTFKILVAAKIGKSVSKLRLISIELYLLCKDIKGSKCYWFNIIGVSLLIKERRGNKNYQQNYFYCMFVIKYYCKRQNSWKLILLENMLWTIPFLVNLNPF